MHHVEMMKFFKLIRSHIDIAPLLGEVRANDDAWFINTSRQGKIEVQRDTNTIFLRSPVRRPDLNVNENQETQATKVSARFPKAVAFMTAFAEEMDAGLSRATIVRLKPRSQVYRHIDGGSYYLIRDRYHLVLQSPAGSVLASGDEHVRMQEGDLWWFNNKQYHEAYNESEEWRIHYIFDLLPAQFARLAINASPAPSQSNELIIPSSNTPTNGVSSRSHLLSAITNRAILRSEKQRLIAPNGTSNKWLIDLRRILMEASVLNAVADLFWETCADLMPFQVGGMEVAAIPLLVAIITKSQLRGTPINGFIVRKERKTYGAGNLIEGEVKDDPILVIDDILNSGNSLEKVRVVLEHIGKHMRSAFVLIDYESNKGKTWRENHQISIRAPFRLTDFNLSLDKQARSSQGTTFHNVWNFASPDPNFFHRVPKSFPVNDGTHVYFGSDSGNFWCLNAHDGSVEWKFYVNAKGHKNIWSAPALHDNKVLFGSYDGNVYCLDAKTGKEVWRFIGADWVGSSPALAPELGLLFIGLEFSVEGKRGSIVALNLETGEKVWEHNTKRYTHASPAYWPERQLVACGSNDNEMFLFDARTGTMLWRFETKSEIAEKGSIRHAPAFDVKRGHVIAGCADGRIYIIDVETGKEVWSVQTDNTIYTIPLVVDDIAYVGSTDKYLYILDLEKKTVKNKIYTGSKIFGPPRLLAGKIYFGACNGIVYEIDPALAQVTGTHQLPDAVTNAVSYNPNNGLFYALTYVNQLFAFTRL
jgi:outer membrane protein assembly factor BamB/orotate phosphoribosyltransferase